MRNVWIGAITKRLSSYLNEVLACDLDEISSVYRVTTMMDGVLRAIDKEFSLPANYPKGHGDQFLHWLKEHYPEALMVTVERASGPRQDLAVEGAAAGIGIKSECTVFCEMHCIHYIFSLSIHIQIIQVLHPIFRGVPRGT